MAKNGCGWNMPGMGWRCAVSALCFFLLLAFLILWLFFYADAYTVYQNIAVVVVSILVFLGVMGAAWASWGMKYGPQMEKYHKEHYRQYAKKPARKAPSKAKRKRK